MRRRQRRPRRKHARRPFCYSTARKRPVMEMAGQWRMTADTLPPRRLLQCNAGQRSRAKQLDLRVSLLLEVVVKMTTRTDRQQVIIACVRAAEMHSLWQYVQYLKSYVAG